MCVRVIRFRTHHPRPEIENNALITFYRSVQMCTHTSSAFRVLHPPSIIILIEISVQITKYVCKNPYLYNLCLLQYKGAKITTNTWVSDALELDIVSVTLICFYVSLF